MEIPKIKNLGDEGNYDSWEMITFGIKWVRLGKNSSYVAYGDSEIQKTIPIYGITEVA